MYNLKNIYFVQTYYSLHLYIVIVIEINTKYFFFWQLSIRIFFIEFLKNKNKYIKINAICFRKKKFTLQFLDLWHWFPPYWSCFTSLEIGNYSNIRICHCFFRFNYINNIQLVLFNTKYTYPGRHEYLG
jgi:hypothetical protein